MCKPKLIPSYWQGYLKTIKHCPFHLKLETVCFAVVTEEAIESGRVDGLMIASKFIFSGFVKILKSISGTDRS